MINRKDYIFIGTIAKPHGLEGELSVVLDKPIAEIGATVIMVEIDGLFVPYQILKTKGLPRSLVVQLQEVENIEQAERLIDKKIHIAQNEFVFESQEVKSSQLQGYLLTDITTNWQGEISEMVDYSGNVLLIIMEGENERLIPYVEEYIISIDHETKQIEADLPEGILSL